MRKWFRYRWPWPEDIWAVGVTVCVILVLILLLSGCVTVKVLGDMPLPEAPAITFQSCQVANVATICISEADANKLRAYFDSLNAYRHAVDRLHQVVEAPADTALKQPIWLVGPYTIFILDVAEVEEQCHRVGAPASHHMVGCYLPSTRVIYTINDASVLAHEFKHALEPNWKHE